MDLKENAFDHATFNPEQPLKTNNLSRFWNFWRSKHVPKPVKFNYWEKNLPYQTTSKGFKSLKEGEKYSIFNCYDDIEETDARIYHKVNMNEDFLENLSLVKSEEMSNSQIWKDRSLIDHELKGFFQKLS